MGPLGLLLGPLGWLLGPSWPQEGTKRPKNLEKTILGPPLGRHVEAKNLSKIGPKSDPKGDDLFIVFAIDF